MIRTVALLKTAMDMGLEAEILSIITKKDTANPEMFDMHSMRIVAMTIMHLRFLIRFGPNHPDGKTIKQGKRIYAHFPSAYKAWICLGCPGIHDWDLEPIIEAHKLTL